MTARAQRLARRSDDPFFTTGNYLSHRDDESVILYLHNDGNDNDEETWRKKDGDDDDNDDDDDDGYYPCPAPECHLTFESLTTMERHYQMNHSFECSVCQRVFQNNHLLDLHVEETHDTYFATSLSRQRTRYRCLVPTCPVTFIDDERRHDHLRAIHAYPRWFRFRPKVDEEALRCDVARRLRWLEKGRGGDRRRGVGGEREGGGDGCDEAQRRQRRQRRAVRKERQKAKRRAIKCRFFFSDGGCFRGERCRFSHDDGGLSKGHGGSNDDEGDAVMETLADDLSKKGCVTVPEDISFGRRGQRVLL